MFGNCIIEFGHFEIKAITHIEICNDLLFYFKYILNGIEFIYIGETMEFT